jgi:sulfur relay protein TusB/DsrH
VARLHQLLSADPRAWQAAARFCLPGDCVVLADAGTVLLADGAFEARFRSAAPQVEMLILEVDANARGLSRGVRESGIRPISDREWVALACSHEQVLSWK